MHEVIKIIFYINHIKNADNWVAAILDMQISKCNVISGYIILQWVAFSMALARPGTILAVVRGIARMKNVWKLVILESK